VAQSAAITRFVGRRVFYATARGATPAGMALARRGFPATGAVFFCVLSSQRLVAATETGHVDAALTRRKKGVCDSDWMDNLTAKTLMRVLALSVAILAVSEAPTPALARTGSPNSFDFAETSAGNYLAALIAGAKRDTVAGAVYWREALRGDPRNKDILTRAFAVTLADGDFDNAERLAKRIVAHDKKNGLARILLGVEAMKARKYVKARKEFGLAGGRGAQADLTASLLTAWTEVGSGRLSKALAANDRVVRDPGLVAYRDFFGGLMADVGGDRAEALRRLEAAYKADPSVIRVADAYARVLARDGKSDEALKIYEKLLEDGPQPLVEQPYADLKAGRIPDPLIGTVTEGAAELFYGLGTLGGRSGDELAALIYLQLASYLDPRNEVVRFTMAEVFEHMEQFDRAADFYATVPDNSPLKSRAVIRYAISMNKLKRGDEGIEALKAEIARVPDDFDAADTLAALLRTKKEWLASAEVYSAALARIKEPARQNWNLFFGRGIAYERAKQWPKAEADLQEALKLIPAEPTTPVDRRDRAQVLNYLGYSWADKSLNIAAAFEMLKKAVELAPTDGYIVDSLGWAYYRQGRYDDAVRELERAVELKPADPTINDHLGDAYWRVGRKLEAHFQWNHARDLKPDPDDLPKILAKIEHGLQDEPATTVAEPSKKDGG